MTTLPYLLYRCEQVRQLDKYITETLGISSTVLMERAGAAAFVELQKRWIKAKNIIVLCGIGNNGGDGFVLARLAKEAGMNVTVLQVGDINRLSGDALAAMQRLQTQDITTQVFANQDLADADVLVDALLGTGLKGDVNTEYAAAIAAINQSGQPVLALDTPSGLNLDTGMPHGCAVRATCTIALLGLKRGLFTGDGPDYAGTVVFHDLSVPATVYAQQTAEVERCDFQRYKAQFKVRARVTHKGQCGHVLIIGGDEGFSGAVRMAGEAALRCGAGLVTIATRAAHAAVMNASRPELMVHAVEDPEQLTDLVARADVIAIGPGLGQQEWGRAMLNFVLNLNKPLIVDADALNLLSQQPQRRDQWVLTPHEGEAARLLGRSASEVHGDRFAAMTALQQQFGGTIVLKGAGTLVATATPPVLLCNDGNPGMASGGMGDVLTGTMASLVAQGFPLSLAAQTGVALHAAAGDAAAKAAGERGLLASDLMSWLRRLVNPT